MVKLAHVDPHFCAHPHPDPRAVDLRDRPGSDGSAIADRGEDHPHRDRNLVAVPARGDGLRADGSPIKP
jgi:hypothetical protein